MFDTLGNMIFGINGRNISILEKLEMNLGAS